MKNIYYALLLGVFTLDYLANRLGIIPRSVALLPEAVVWGLGAVLIIKIGMARKFGISPSYLILILFLAVAAILGAILNAEDPGSFVGGVRNYVKYLPLIFMGALLEHREKDLRRLLMVVLVLAFLQVPIAVIQRLETWGLNTGDYVTGTLSTSSILSIFLVCVIIFIWSLKLKDVGRMKFVLGSVVVLMLPVTINETKGALVLLVCGFLATLYAQYKGDIDTKIGGTVIVGGVAVALFAAIYNMAPGQMRERSVSAFFVDGEIVDYFYSGIKEDELAQRKTADIGRGDAIRFALENLSKDVPQLMFGLGIGSVSKSVSEYIAGEHYDKYLLMQPQRVAVSQVLWEMGIIGTVLMFIGCVLVIRDALRVAVLDGVEGGIGIGMVGVIVVYAISLLYKNVILVDSLNVLIYYFSGIVAGRSYRLRMAGRNKLEQQHAVQIGRKKHIRDRSRNVRYG